MPYNSNGERLLKARIAAAMQRGARGASEYLKDATNEEGSGRFHPHLPNRSARSGEYPSVQFGKLTESIGFTERTAFSYEFGALNNPPPEAFFLEFAPSSVGGSAWLTKALYDPELHRAALNAMRSPT